MNSLKRLHLNSLWQPLKYQFRNRKTGIGNIEGTFSKKPHWNLVKMLQNREKNSKKMTNNNNNNKQHLQGVSNSPKIYENTKPRMKSLNSIFMVAVTEALTLGKLGNLLAPYEVQITQIKFAPNYRTAGIYWVAPSLEDSKREELLKLFSIIAVPLREQIIKQNLIHNTPRFNFVEDIYHLKNMELEKGLEIADYGPDYGTSPSTPDQQFKKSLEVALLPKQKLTNIFNLDRDKIMRRVEERRSHSSGTYDLSTMVDYEALHRPFNRPRPIPPNPNPDYTEDHERVAMIQESILEKKRQKYKQMKSEDRHQERLMKIHEENLPKEEFDYEAPPWAPDFPSEDQYVEEDFYEDRDPTEENDDYK